jgi:hypothetical protein
MKHACVGPAFRRRGPRLRGGPALSGLSSSFLIPVRTSSQVAVCSFLNDVQCSIQKSRSSRFPSRTCAESGHRSDFVILSLSWRISDPHLYRQDGMVALTGRRSDWQLSHFGILGIQFKRSTKPKLLQTSTSRALARTCNPSFLCYTRCSV